MNTGAPWPTPAEAEARVLRMQAKLHRWATDDHARRFVDLFNLVADPAFLLVAWRRVRGNRGARSAGIDGQTAHEIEAGRGEAAFLADLRADLRGRTFRPLPVRERMIPKAGGKRRRLGIPTVRDRVVQAALKLVLEPIFEADFAPCSYGFRPGRRTQDAIAEIHLFASRSYEWVVDADISACFDEIDHRALLDRVRGRIGDRRVLALVAAFLRAGILGEDGVERDTATGTPQGGILSPLLANIALSVLDDHFVAAWAAMGAHSGARQQRRRTGLATYRLVRYADDFVVLVAGTRAHAEAVRDEAAAVLAPMGLRLSPAKTRIAHIDEGFDFLGFRVRRQPEAGHGSAVRLHLPGQDGARVGQGQGAGADPRGDGPLARHPPAPAQPGAPGLDRLLPVRRVEGDLQLPARLRLAPGGVLAPPQAPPIQLDAAPPALPSRVVADGGRGDPVQPERGGGQPLPLPGRTDPLCRGRNG